MTKTEFNSFVWWDLRNGTDTSGDFSASLYGWRTNGDLGIIGNLNTLYPTFYTFKLMQHFVQPGDTVLTAASDYSLLSVYAVRRLDGSLTVLAINKDPSNTSTGQVAVAGFTPASSGTVYSYGIPQDNAAETNGSRLAGHRHKPTFPARAQTSITPSRRTRPPCCRSHRRRQPCWPCRFRRPPASSSFNSRVKPGVPYVIQHSTNLMTWTSISTNTPLAGTMNITNSVDPSLPMQFWRAIWQP